MLLFFFHGFKNFHRIQNYSQLFQKKIFISCLRDTIERERISFTEQIFNIINKNSCFLTKNSKHAVLSLKKLIYKFEKSLYYI
jgi:hypothetical protein